MMSHVTRCPFCRTAFRVSETQLDMRGGRVRCGQCRQVFDARAALDLDKSTPAPATAAESASWVGTLPDVLPAYAWPTVDAPPPGYVPGTLTGVNPIDAAIPPDAAVPPDSAISPHGSSDDPSSGAEQSLTSQPPTEATGGASMFVDDTPSSSSSDLAPEPAVASEPLHSPPAPEAEATPVRIASPAQDPQPSKKRPIARAPAETPFRFGRAPVRSHTRAWGWLAFLLLIALNVQALFYFRGAIALVWPTSKTAIESLCASLGCDVPLPKRAELLSIETSDLQAEPSRPGVMTLSATLRNRAAFPQAFPALELTLTNERDQPLARRVLKPADYLRRGSEDGIPTCSGGVASCEVQVRLFLEATALKASGYRLYLFYP